MNQEDFKEDFHMLQTLVKWLNKNNHFQISIHDASGVLYGHPSLRLTPNQMIHSSSFCSCAKSTAAGLRYCLKCKTHSIYKAMRSKQMFVGTCYLGITEIVQPVFWHNRLVCIIYLGNLYLEEDQSKRTHQIIKMCQLTGVKEELLLGALKKVGRVDKGLLEEYKEIVQMLYYHIASFLKTQSDKRKEDLQSSIDRGKYDEECHWVINSIRNYVVAYYDKEIRLSDLAKLHCINYEYLCRLFKKEMGIGFTKYIHEIRIKEAKKLLVASEDTILNISLEVGFQSISYFNRLFKKYEGVTPTEYRKN